MSSQPYSMEASEELGPGVRQTVLMSGADNEGAFSLVLLQLPPHSEAPLSHCHPWHSEGYFVLRGMLVVTQGESTITLGQGMASLTPAGVTHTYWNPAATPLVALLHYTPGGPTEHALALASATHSAGFGLTRTDYPAEELTERGSEPA